MFEFFKNIFCNTNKLYYFGGKKSKNAGDIFNVDLMKYFGIKYKRTKKFKNANLVCVCSNLDYLNIKSKTKITIAGGGFIFPLKEDEKLSREVEILALRGAIAKARMERLLNTTLNDCVLADPGLLVSKIYPQSVDKKYKLGIIPHYFDKNMVNFERVKLDNFLIIDIQQDVKDVVKQICQCECILSSSLHGLIFSDSYNIPNRQLILSDNLAGGCYKFEDYYSAFDLTLPKPVDLRKDVIDNDLINEILCSYKVKDIEAKQEELTKVFIKLAVG